MKFLSFNPPDSPSTETASGHIVHLGVLENETVIDLAACRLWAHQNHGLALEPLDGTLLELIQAGEGSLDYIKRLLACLKGESASSLQAEDGSPLAYKLEAVHLYPPLPRPNSLRDFYAFEQHVITAFANRERPVPPEWYQFPAFYYSNPNAIFGPGELIPYPSYTQELDYELEIACVIGKPGINISAEDAGQYIFGYTLLNDWSARDIQRLENKIGLGPAKGKDFATSLGPWIVTPDELAERATGRVGVFDLRLCARVNGVELSSGNWKDIHYSFGEMIARASQEAYLLPGDVLGSGTVGTGCLLELTHARGPWLQPGDIVEFEADCLGVLGNRVRRFSKE